MFCMNWELEDTSSRHLVIMKSKKHIQIAENGM